MSPWANPQGRFGSARIYLRGDPPLELTNEDSIADAARRVEPLAPVRLVFVCTGFLHDTQSMPERSFREIEAHSVARAFAINAMGPALIMKYFLPLLPKQERSVCAVLSAKVGSVGDNRLGGSYSCRASKAALNQLIRTAAIELHRSKPDAICLALHPGTVETPLSSPFATRGLNVGAPSEAAAALVEVVTATSLKKNRDVSRLRGRGNTVVGKRLP